MARALWVTAPGRVELRKQELSPGERDLVIETLYSGISRGTEALVFRGGVPPSEFERMRCPMQGGEFPFPVKYGYAAVGRVVAGEAHLGQGVFALHPHQDRFAAPSSTVVPLPPGLPPGRAVLAANMETALNVVWDGGAAPGDHIAVVGAGTVGALAGWLCARIPGTEVTLVDVNPARAALAATLGCRFGGPGAARGACDLVIHASASGEGLATALALAGREAAVVEASWYGDRPVTVELGGAFHSRRLRIVASQVGAVPESRRARWPNRRRLAKALELLADPALDALISGETDFAELPERYGAILADPATLCHRVRY
jgi:2-desacetyl-2-hydroxyethyl bacteriochlorophyllide A dehydrogenase